MATKKGQAFKELTVAPQETFIKELADKFKSQMDAYFRKNLSDDPIMLEWHRNFADILERGTEYPPVKKWIRPSMVGSDEQAIWMHLHGYKPDTYLLEEPQDEVHTRWQAIGTVVGDMWQRQVLAAEYWTKKGKDQVDFAFERVNIYDDKTGTDYGNMPMFEEFARKYVELDGVPVWGTCDGILNYIGECPDSDGGGQVRIGFEVKSKQTTNASTGTYKMKTYEEKHRQQILTYALMYDLDYYFILYQNCSKKGWTQDEETKAKYPDLRVFGIYISEEDKRNHIRYLQRLWELRNTEEKPPLDPLKWTFNSHKISAIVNMTDKEFVLLKLRCRVIDESKEYTAFEKKQAWECLEEVRQGRDKMKQKGGN